MNSVTPDVRTPGGNRADAEHKNTFNDEFISQAGETDKLVAMLRAKAELAGCGLHQLASGGWVLTRWNLAKECPDLRSLGVLLGRLGSAK